MRRRTLYVAVKVSFSHPHALPFKDFVAYTISGRCDSCMLGWLIEFRWLISLLSLPYVRMLQSSA